MRNRMSVSCSANARTDNASISLFRLRRRGCATAIVQGAGKVAEPDPAARHSGARTADAARREDPKCRRKQDVRRTLPQDSFTLRHPSHGKVGRALRRRGLSVARFAERLGVSPTTVYRWEAASGLLHPQARPLKAVMALYRQFGKRAR